MPPNTYLATIKFKVKRLVSIVFMLTCLLSQSVAQTTEVAPNFPGVTFRWSIGYAGHAGNQTIPAPVINTLYPAIDAFGPLTSISGAGAAGSVIHNSYGQGLNVGVHVGYMFNAYIGVELGIHYTQSTQVSAYQQTILYQPDSSNHPAPSGGYLDNQITTKAQSLTLAPTLVVAFSKPKFKIYPYIRAGVVLPVFTQITHNLTMNLDGYGATPTLVDAPYYLGGITTATYNTRPAFTAGVTGAIGMVWRPINFVNFFVELNGQYLNMKASSTTITEWTEDGYDQLAARGTYRTQFNYVKNLNGNSNNAQYNANYDINKPKQDISPVFPFNNIGFNVGVQLVLSKKVFKDEDGFDQDRSKKVKVVKAKKKKEADDARPAQ